MTEQYLLPRSMPRDGVISTLLRRLAALPADRAWRVELHEQKATRSNQQNRYLWGVCYPEIIRQGGEALAGWTAEELHDYCLGEHFGWERTTAFGRTKMRPLRRSSRLSKMEFVDFVAFIQRRMAEHGIVIPDPDQEFSDD